MSPQAILLLSALIFAGPLALAHKQPGPVLTCQPYTGEQYHDYIPPATGTYASVGDGNMQDCGPDTWTVGPVFQDYAANCQRIKAIRDDPTQHPDLRFTASTLHALLCTALDTSVSKDVQDFDGEWDYGQGGVILAVNTGDMATWGAYVCYGMTGHHTGNIYAEEWPTGVGPAMGVMSDYSRTPPAPSSPGKAPPPDCGDNVVETCEGDPPPSSTAPFPVNVVIDTVASQHYALFGPGGNGTTCNINDCARYFPANPFGPSHALMLCPPGIGGAYFVFLQPDPNTPLFPQMGHVWTY